MKPYIIAYYLPQFHPFKENDEWWGKGFTEWTNVGKAKPLFKGHLQPRVPADLGYYDLRLPIVREQQVALAKEAGVDAFCYWHYWFGGKGRQLMNNIIDEVHESGKPDFPFCLGWANESWKAKQWNVDGKGDKFLMEQRYGGDEDYRLHFDYVKELFKDKRYVRVNGKPFFLIYKPGQFNEVTHFMKLWNNWIKEEGIADGIYFVASIDLQEEKDQWLEIGFDAIVPAHRQRIEYSFLQKPKWLRGLVKLKNRLVKRPLIYSMKEFNKMSPIPSYDGDEKVIPFLLPQWDHTPRSGVKGYLVKDSTPDEFQKQCAKMLQLVSRKKNNLVILKSWNEWAEGNYMEPDLKYGKGFINALITEKNKL